MDPWFLVVSSTLMVSPAPDATGTLNAGTDKSGATSSLTMLTVADDAAPGT